MIEVMCKVREYPEGKPEYRTLYVVSHHNDDCMVILSCGDDLPRLRVVGRDLITAVENAMRSAR